ncbi:phage gp6-like head-tail connector protein [Clostridium botulinum]
MIISLEEAKRILKIDNDSEDEDIKDDLDAIEIMIRNKTNNNFQDRKIRVRGNFLFENNKIMGIDFLAYGFRKGSTIEINDSLLNNGLYVVIDVNSNSIIVDKTLEYEQSVQTMITKVLYPLDIKRGIKKLLKYDNKMADKIGIKQETIARVSTTYFDMGSNESVEGYPAALLKFLDKYKKLRWS